MLDETRRWFTSSYSNNGGSCVEVAGDFVASRGVVPVRDSKRPDSAHLAISGDAWNAFPSTVK